LDPTKSVLAQVQTILHPQTHLKANKLTSPRVLASLRVPPLPRVADNTPKLGVHASKPIAKQACNARNNFIPPNFYAKAVAHPVMGKPMEYCQLIANPITQADWQVSAAKEFGRLAQGVRGRIKGTNTIFFISHHDMPAD
jgi:hypothetical protein